MPRNATPVGRAGITYPRKRSVAACQVCRARKTKCDQKKPRCSFCESINVECISDSSSFSGLDPASLTILSQIQNLSEKLDRLVQKQAVSESRKLEASAAHKKCIFPETIDSITKWPCLEPHCSVSSPMALFGTPSSAPESSLEPLSLDELEPAACNQWLDNFFISVHIKNPVLDEDHIRRLVRRVCHDGLGWNVESCLALLICANGALAQPFPDPAHTKSDEDKAKAKSLYRLGQRRLGLAMGSKELVQAQCFFYAGVYLMSALKPFHAWRMFLQALAVCQSFGSSTRRHTNTASQNSDQEKIYWSCWKSEREVRWELGLPDFAESALDHAQSFPSLATNLEGESLRAGYFFLSEISLWRLETKAKGEILSICQSTTDSFNSELLDLTSDLSHQLTVWHESLAPSVNIGLPNYELENHDVLRFILRGRVTYYNELLYWYYVVTTLENEHVAPNLEEPTRRGLEMHLERLIVNTPGFYHRHHGTWLMLRSSARSACILLLFAQNSSLVTLLPSGWMPHVQDTIGMLQFWSAEDVSIGEISDLLKRLIKNVVG